VCSHDDEVEAKGAQKEAVKTQEADHKGMFVQKSKSRETTFYLLQTRLADGA
jgi:DNA-directed RNA polymerase subunit M/transcription elongation factor TFIIS